MNQVCNYNVRPFFTPKKHRKASFKVPSSVQREETQNQDSPPQLEAEPEVKLKLQSGDTTWI
ncbi:hypothetical protein P7K49_024906 [Saguinus oedipus]|uniref:Uncharacterized protein n=1 Tax=Saguinus oedipus TaxID=9490 RepID=A0ABQ9UHW2_SAGOE|nr:hypothetical protein P7K49_024906 [Saguinus oedipus]